MDIIYVYTVVKEDFITGERVKRKKKCTRFVPDLEVGGLYCHLGDGFSGCYRVLALEEVEA